MDDSSPAAEALRLATPCLPAEDEANGEAPADFVPLRILLQPGGLCIELNKPDMLVGRHSGADVRLSLPDISRRHCRFTFEDGHWEVLDLNSLNGIYVNGQRLREATLFDGDALRIASLTFLVELQGQPRLLKRTADSRSGVLRSIVDLLPQSAADEQRRAS